MNKLIAMFLVGMIQQRVFARCPTGINQSHGVVYYTGRYSEKCNWNFMKGANLKRDVILSVQFLYFRSYKSYTVLLPNNQRMNTRSIPLYGEPWCGVYVKRNDGNETTCRAGIKLSGKCRNQPETVVSRFWPPRMTTTKVSQITVSYAVLECPQSSKIYPLTTEASLTTNILASTSGPSTTTSGPSTTKCQESLMATAVTTTLGVLLGMALIVIYVLFRKTRTRKSNIDTIYAEIETVANRPPQSNEVINNEIYVSAEAVGL